MLVRILSRSTPRSNSQNRDRGLAAGCRLIARLRDRGGAALRGQYSQQSLGEHNARYSQERDAEKR